MDPRARGLRHVIYIVQLQQGTQMRHAVPINQSIKSERLPSFLRNTRNHPKRRHDTSVTAAITSFTRAITTTQFHGPHSSHARVDILLTSSFSPRFGTHFLFQSRYQLYFPPPPPPQRLRRRDKSSKSRLRHIPARPPFYTIVSPKLFFRNFSPGMMMFDCRAREQGDLLLCWIVRIDSMGAGYGLS